MRSNIKIEKIQIIIKPLLQVVDDKLNHDVERVGTSMYYMYAMYKYECLQMKR